MGWTLSPPHPLRIHSQPTCEYSKRWRRVGPGGSVHRRGRDHGGFGEDSSAGDGTNGGFERGVGGRGTWFLAATVWFVVHLTHQLDKEEVRERNARVDGRDVVESKKEWKRVDVQDAKRKREEGARDGSKRLTTKGLVRRPRRTCDES